MWTTKLAVPTSAAALLLLLLLLWTPRGHRAAGMTVFRLPRDATRPVSYELRLALLDLDDADRPTFGGVASITVVAAAAVHVITLNARDLDVAAVAVTDVRAAADVPVTGVALLADDEQLEIRLGAPALPGRAYLVTVTYGGRVRDDHAGLYWDGDGTNRFAVTRLEPSFARTLFPCYDEPAYKAVFNISVMKKKIHVALSNMPVRDIEIGPNDTEIVHFESTPPMSTYLVAIFVGEIESNKINNTKITMHVMKENISQTKFIGVEASKALGVMEEYTGIEYSLPKMDMLFLRYYSGAMEHWGLIIYDDVYIQMNENSKESWKLFMWKCMQHEIAHQWFGNLVTCAWWDYFWLNEGLATYFQYFATKMVWKKWPMEELFVFEVQQSALWRDMKSETSPITGSIHYTDDMIRVQDITYNKAASVLRMLRHVVTEKLFQLSLRYYLNAKRENVAEPSDLFTSFDNVLADNNYDLGNGLTVNEFMSNWTLQAGYPVVKITRDDISNTFLVTQSRFLDNSSACEENASSAWHIGLTFTTESSKDFGDVQPYVWTSKTSKSTVLPAPENSGWYIFNIKSTGFYRVNYDIANWMALIKQMNEAPTEIHVINRAQLIDDAFCLASVGQLNISVPLSLAEYLKNENDKIPWQSAMFSFTEMILRRGGDKEYGNSMPRIIKLVEILSIKLKTLVMFDNSLTIWKVYWYSALKWSCNFKNNNCSHGTFERFEFEKKQENKRTSTDFKTVVFKVDEKTTIVV